MVEEPPFPLENVAVAIITCDLGVVQGATSNGTCTIRRGLAVNASMTVHGDGCCVAVAVAMAVKAGRSPFIIGPGACDIVGMQQGSIAGHPHFGKPANKAKQTLRLGRKLFFFAAISSLWRILFDNGGDTAHAFRYFRRCGSLRRAQANILHAARGISNAGPQYVLASRQPLVTSGDPPPHGSLTDQSTERFPAPPAMNARPTCVLLRRLPQSPVRVRRKRSGLNSRVQCKQIRLIGNLIDNLIDFRDLIRTVTNRLLYQSTSRRSGYLHVSAGSCLILPTH